MLLDYWVYYFFLFWSAISWPICINLGRGSYKKIYFVVNFFPLAFLAALRGDHVGADTQGYLMYFRQLADMEIEGWRTDIFESGYVIYNKICFSLGLDKYDMLFLISFVTVIGFGCFFYLYSSNLFVSTIVFMGMWFYLPIFTTTRQCFATMIICNVFGYLCNSPIKFKNRIVAMLCIIFAGSFHSSVLVFLVFVILYPINKKKFLFIVFVGIYGYLIFKDNGLLVLAEYADYVSYAHYIGGKYDVSTEFGAQVIKAILCIICGIWGVKVSKKLKGSEYNLCMLSSSLSMLSAIYIFCGYEINIVNRMVYSSFIFVTILLPILFNEIENSVVKYTFLIFGVLVYFTKSLSVVSYEDIHYYFR